MSDLSLTVRSDSIAIIVFDQQGSKANVLTVGLWQELEAILDSLATRTELKGLVLASAKPDIFIAGADLKLFANSTDPNNADVRKFIEEGLRILGKLENLPFPTVAAIDGVALGGGLEVTLACDYRIAGPNPKLKIGLPEVTLALMPGWGGTQRLPRLIGIPNAARMIVSGQPIDGEQAQLNSLANEFAKDDNVVDVAANYVQKFPRFETIREKKRSPIASWTQDGDSSVRPNESDSPAIAEARRVVNLGSLLPFSEGIELETEAFMRLAGSEDSRRLISAFFASRRK